MGAENLEENRKKSYIVDLKSFDGKKRSLIIFELMSTADNHGIVCDKKIKISYLFHVRG